MPTIPAMLRNYDLDLVQRIAHAWDLEISQREVESARIDLAAGMSVADGFHKFMESLDSQVQNAWLNLASRGGRQTWAEFSRLNGDVRNYGPARRERENPDKNPVSVAEILWFAGLIGRAFFGGAGEPVEYAYIPDELLSFLTSQSKDDPVQKIRPAVSQSPRFIMHSRVAILDYATDLLAALRMRRDIPDESFSAWGIPEIFLRKLVHSAGLVDPEGQPDAEALKTFFSSSTSQVITRFYQSWFTSLEINELRMLPGINCEGSWQNDPLAPRRMLSGLLDRLGVETWWSISSLVAMIKETTPDFQRPTGDYDSWFIRDQQTGAFLHGFNSWDRVEGELIYSLLTGPMYWFGVVNLARGNTEGRFTAFQIQKSTKGFLHGETNVLIDRDSRDVKIKDVRTMIFPVGSPRMLRYQTARFTELVNSTTDESRYQITTRSLRRAEEQGLQIQQLLQLLEKEQPGVVPASLHRMAERWVRHGIEAGFNRVSLLRFADPTTCTEFRKSAGSRFELEELNPKTLLVQSRQIEAIQKLLNELGILVDREADV